MAALEVGQKLASTVMSEQSINDLIGNATQRVEVILNLVTEYEQRILGNQPTSDPSVDACPNGILDSARNLGRLVDLVHERLIALLPSLG